jgi:two-component system phosphate regulon response regulator PhoB
MQTPEPKIWTNNVIWTPRLARLLVVDGSAEDRTAIVRELRNAGHDAVPAADAAGAYRLLQDSSFDAVITEWLLPDTTALDLAATLRGPAAAGPQRVVVASRRSEARDIARALDSGIDDYLVKSSRPEELVARVNAILRRPFAPPPDSVVQVGRIRLDRVGHRVLVGDAELDLAPAEFRLIAFFMENRGKMLGRQQLLAQVWNRRNGISPRTVDVHVRRLRAALAPFGCQDLLQTVRGFGYRFG